VWTTAASARAVGAPQAPMAQSAAHSFAMSVRRRIVESSSGAYEVSWRARADDQRYGSRDPIRPGGPQPAVGPPSSTREARGGSARGSLQILARWSFRPASLRGHLRFKSA
jgi:hypothetical protein